MDTSTHKRPRASSSSFATFPDGGDPPHKSSRIAISSKNPPLSSFEASTMATEGSALVTGHPLYCSLPPTCHHKPTPIANTQDLERHYGTYHAHVCELDNCGCVFPDARLMELHQNECHDPIAALRRERGEKIFQCHIPAPACGRNFLTPKARRLHLIQSHGYLKEYFFAVTNKGIGGLLKKWGEGATMIRKEWKPREGKGDSDQMDEDDSDEEQLSQDDEDKVLYQKDDDRTEDEEEEPADLEATPRMLPRTTGIHSPQSSIASSKGSDRRQSRQRNRQHAANNDATATVAGLTDSMNSLSLVPDSIRFGRGGKSGAIIPNPRGFRGRGRGRGGHGGSQAANANVGPTGRAGGGFGPSATGNTVDGPQPEWVSRGRGRGRPMLRGRGRGRGD
ncbi:Zinc finger protein 511 [Psilocybe cubensis]|uniref:C2H2-type domain-containing protein n=2 Tax=Psilocybe cubensis TaxID=181762 RepID=A0A8H7XR78_PSICU|nr:Zinc finger protein 511 [Psilocybe cubensis]KAH9479316.1 Zinc finger protein 511 [Psilocybe cubensis]